MTKAFSRMTGAPYLTPRKMRARKRRDLRRRIESRADSVGVFYYPWEANKEILIKVWTAQGLYTPPGEKPLPAPEPVYDCELCGDTGEVAGDPLSDDGMGPCPDCFPPDSMGD